MNAQEKIRKYICKKAWSRWAGMAGLAAAALVLILALVAALRADTAVKPFSRENAAAGTMVSVEITGVSDWLYRTRNATYYAAQDAEGNNYTLCLTQEQFSRMGPQALYYLTQAGEMPAPYTLTGCVQYLPYDVGAGLADIWGITLEEWENTFGNLVINCTTDARREAASPYLSPAWMLALAGLALSVWFWRTELTARRCLARLEKLGLTEAAAEQLGDLESCMLLGDDRGKLTKDFLFGRGTGFACLRSDVAWAYRTEKSRLFLLPRTVLMAGTRHTGLRTAVNMKRFDRLGVTGDVIAALGKENPALLVGKTRENTAAFRKMGK